VRSADFLGKPFRAGESGTGDGASSSAAAWTLTMVTGARPGAGCREGLASVAGWLPRVSIGCARMTPQPAEAAIAVILDGLGQEIEEGGGKSGFANKI
jgi:hypothetical protein